MCKNVKIKKPHVWTKDVLIIILIEDILIFSMIYDFFGNILQSVNVSLRK